MTHQSQLKKMVGQMIISGFRGIHLNQKNQIIKDNQKLVFIGNKYAIITKIKVKKLKLNNKYFFKKV